MFNRGVPDVQLGLIWDLITDLGESDFTFIPSGCSDFQEYPWSQQHLGSVFQDESRFYSVDLERGPTGFGFSLRGGSEYNMGLYVLGLMEGGPAQRSNKIQVSDQLVEINGDSTAGMTHSQAVEQIRRGGHRIHLVLKKGNGYVPDYVELSSLSLCMTNSKQGEPCFYVIGRTENPRP
ncbi:hypothetical protein CHARACLAT_028964 [Characodon lateralis]|uniref:PDZ domain-containing protein n=2 Tax=Goodeidae TaxID=28758 RepID=A0ABU7DKR6_9TELE|nr:hypothetical protein [Characodon lateralis]